VAEIGIETDRLAQDTPIAASRRRQIEGVASALFRERGYAGTGMREIARGLQLRGASLYAHVGSKEDVLFAIVDRAADRFATAISPYLHMDGMPPEYRLRGMIGAHVMVLTDDLGDAVVFLHEWRFLSPERRAHILSRRDNHELAFRNVIADGVEAGDFRLIDERIAARSLLSALNGIAGWWRPDGPLSADQIAESYADLHLAGLIADPADRLLEPRRTTR
jgi:TetR/AcrR family transcriptional regulator, cholesterol catabolism regulator